MKNPAIVLTRTKREDLDQLFHFQLDKEARYLAAFMSQDADSKTAYIEKHTRFLTDPSINMQTIKINHVVVGSIAKFMMENEAEITYWVDKKYWAQGIATAALQAFLKMEQTRPLYGRVAFDNYRSQKVLEKCGFVKTGKDKGFANARQAEIEEFIYQLDRP